jgi:ATP-binding cassette, subfamily B, bacterial
MPSRSPGLSSDLLETRRNPVNVVPGRVELLPAETTSGAQPLRHRGRLRRALRFALPYRRTVLTILLITLGLAALNAAEPLILKCVFDSLASKGSIQPLFNGILLLLSLGVFREIATGASNWLTWHTRLGIHYELLENTVERIHRMPLSLHRTEGVGAIMTRLDRGIQGFLNGITQILFNVFPALLYLALSVVVMFNLNWKLAVLVLCFVPMPALLAALAGPEQNRRERSLLDQWVKIYSRFNEVLSGIVTVRSFSMEEMEKCRFLNEVRQANRTVIRGVGIDAGLGAASNLVVTSARIASIGLGAKEVTRPR